MKTYTEYVRENSIKELDEAYTKEELVEILGFAIKDEDRYLIFKKIRSESDKLPDGLSFIYDIKDIVLDIVKKCKKCSRKVLAKVIELIKDLIKNADYKSLTRDSVLASIENTVAIA